MKKYLSRGKLLFGATLTAAALMSGCGNSDNFVFTNTNLTPATPAPVAVNDSFAALGNATVNQAASGVLANDTANGGTITAFDAVGSNGGTIVLNADGSFSYTPVFGFVGAETFTYTLTNATGSSTATVTMTSTGQGFFVNNQAAPGGVGSQADPFDTLAAALAAAGSGDTIFVSRGDGLNTGIGGAFTLPLGVNLIGEGTGLVLAQTIVAPGQAPLINGPITCMGSNTISGFTIDGATGDSIIINGAGDVTITNNTISNPTDNHVDCDDTTGTVTISDNTFSDPPDAGVDYIVSDHTDTNGSIVVTGNTFLNDSTVNVDGLFEPDIMGNSVVSFVFSQNQAIGQVADQFNHGFYLDSEDTSQVTVTVDDNDLTNFDNETIGVHSNNDNAILGGSITNNRIDGVTNDDGMDSYVNGATMTISGNVISNVDTNGIDLAIRDLGGTFIITNNNISNAGNEGMETYNSSDGTNASMAIRNNVVTNAGGMSYNIDWDGSANLCVEFTGNTVDDDLTFNATGGPGTMNVEQLMTLDTVNTLNGVTVNNTGGQAVNQNAGFCAIP